MTKEEFTKIAKPKVIQYLKDCKECISGQWVYYKWSICNDKGRKAFTKIVDILHNDFEIIADKLIEGMIVMAAFYHGDLDTIQLP